MTAFEAKTIEEFLRRAFIPAYQFEGKEWADATGSDTERLRSGEVVGGEELPSRFEPPLVRLYCTGCKNAWDAWVDDDGTLQDSRDARCACKHGGKVIVAPAEGEHQTGAEGS